MPIYEYACDDCRAEFELLVRNGEAPRCPECGGAELSKRWSVPAAHRGRSDLPMCEVPQAGTCGRPECGTGGCRMM